MMPARRSAVVILVLASMTAVASLRAQTCYGTPPRGSLAVDFGKVAFGTTTGFTGAYAGDRFAIGAGYRTLDRGSSTSGNAEQLRLGLVFGGASVQVCPGLGFEFEHDSWNSSIGPLTSNSLIAWGGLSVGLEQKVYKELSLIPFAGLRFAFKAIKYDYSSTSADLAKTTADTSSRGEIQYGLLARYKIIYAGFLADHPLKNAPPFLARYVIGLTLPIKE